MKTTDIRKAYIDFFTSNGHIAVPSAPLVPENDPTTLFTSAGMQPMLPYLLGQPHPLGNRIVNSQKSFRSTDIEEVGDSRHTTFFEMLGNWSLGDYFKEEQIPWVFEFITEKIGLDPQRIYVTVFEGNDDIGIPKDTTSAQIWKDLFARKGIDAKIVEHAKQKGMQDGRIFFYDEQENWWSRAGVPDAMPQGEPGGPDSEIFWDFGEDLGLHESSPFAKQPCHVACDCGRFLEIGNSVFMEYVKGKEGFESLPQKNVDFGGGLERMAAARIDNLDVFMIDVFESARRELENISGVSYTSSLKTTISFRIILDHVRAATFLIADGVIPSNKDQGYFVRRLLRRSIRYAHNLSVHDPFCTRLVRAYIDAYKDAYPELEAARNAVTQAVSDEEEKFRTTLSSGLKAFSRITATLSKGDTISAEQSFNLYQSYGFPLEMTQELAQEHELHVDTKGFEEAFQEHQKRSRVGAEKKFKGGLADHSEQSVHYHTATHLLHQALRTILGEHVLQKGSNITPERLRFDFSHPEKMTPEDISAVEDLVNAKIKEDIPVTHQEMSPQEAKEKGALGLFEHKYADQVSVYSIGNFSIEICGGPHVARTGDLGVFAITKEESAGAGVRRIKAVLK